ncbi:hypothetical protein D6C99_08950 [Aureobasidium pullulans]|nr:hypothetical protein D6D29_10586 [Aureobasidium pullulans]THV81774.1 hypothetical protein D6D27_08529 [Aureobasidium pullulans]THY38730.1 hypothetical protein D6C99_08950 [Aureobasidium pullulans]
MIKEGSPVWPPKGPNVRIFAVDFEGCVYPIHRCPVRGSKYPHYISEWGFAYIDTDTIPAHPDDWHLYITTGHAVVHEHYDHHPDFPTCRNMNINDGRRASYPRNNTTSGPSGTKKGLRIFDEHGSANDDNAQSRGRSPARHRLHATLALAALPEAEARSAPLPIVLPSNDNASNDKQVFTPSKRPKPPKTPKAIAKGSNKLQAKPPKSDDGEEEEDEVEEVEDGSVKVKEKSLQLLKTTLERLRNSELLQCDSHVVRRHDGTNSEIAASPEVDGGFTIATPAANHAALDQPALAQGSQFPKPQPAAIQTS